MSERSFKFSSPGVFIEEVDQSQIPRDLEGVGPTIIGRFEKGPAMKPVKVFSKSDLVETFGNPIAGVGGADDVWRQGNFSAPTYAAYAAMAYLDAGVGPVNVFRLIGTQHESATSPGDGYGGWETTFEADTSPALAGGAYGLFVIASGSDVTALGTGALAAVWYADQGAVVLSGTIAGAAATTASVAQLIESDASGRYTACVLDENSAVVAKKTFNFDRDSTQFIRKVYSTNPQLTNGAITPSDSQEKYWLGETYERSLLDTISTVNTAKTYGFITPIASGTLNKADMRMGVQSAQSGWFIAQADTADLASSYDALAEKRLFKFVGLDNYGAQLTRDFKISVFDIKGPRSKETDFGTFSVGIRRASDKDASSKFVEVYSGLTLETTSPNYIARVIGDQYTAWDDTTRVYRTYGTFPNASKYVRVVMNLTAGAASKIPFGVLGPPRFKGFNIQYSSTDVLAYTPAGSGSAFANAFINPSTTPYRVAVSAGMINIHSNLATFTGSYLFPALATRVSASDLGTGVKSAYFGADTSIASTSNSFDSGYMDYIRPLPQDLTDFHGDQGASGTLSTTLEFSWATSLDDITVITGSGGDIQSAYWASGSRAGGTSYTALGAGGVNGGTWEDLLDNGVNKLTSAMFGGFDGLDIKEAEPFSNTKLSTGTETSNYAYNTVQRAIDTLADPELLQTNIMSIPGLTNEGLTSRLIETCESRGDALAVIDLKGTYQPPHESTDSAASRASNIDTTINNLVNRRLNSSYGCAYYPWVDARDQISGVSVRLPPSVIALGVFASTERKRDLWFAPAGFNRGGLTEGAGGVPVTGVEQRLTSGDRDKLYERNINPIASFPSEGIVVFGQKTLQVTPSALDRINVRRMLIFVKREVQSIANGILFDPNIQVTWKRFKTQAERLLQNVQSRFGIDDFRVILDSSTTTPDLVDRNIIYAKVLIKPTRAAEFIAIDFVITRTGDDLDSL